MGSDKWAVVVKYCMLIFREAEKGTERAKEEREVIHMQRGCDHDSKLDAGH